MGLLRSFLKSLAAPHETAKPSPWLVVLGESLGKSAIQSDDQDDEGIITGGTDDGLGWTLRVVTRIEADADSRPEQHHIVWQCQSIELTDVVLVFGSSSDDAGLWAGLDGVTVRGGALDDQMKGAFDALDHLVWRAESGSLSRQGFMEAMAQPNRESRMATFVEHATSFALPHPLSAPWHAYTTDSVMAARILTPAVIVRIEEWRAKAPTYDSWIRAWVGGPNVRLECWLVDPESTTYRRVIELGLALTRATRDALPH
jgi:hypothetical protein